MSVRNPSVKRRRGGPDRKQPGEAPLLSLKRGNQALHEQSNQLSSAGPSTTWLQSP
ncbi:MAG: hypothetical protein WBE37_11390 [Bryobacteraceae bacterium]